MNYRTQVSQEVSNLSSTRYCNSELARKVIAVGGCYRAWEKRPVAALHGSP